MGENRSHDRDEDDAQNHNEAGRDLSTGTMVTCTTKQKEVELGERTKGRLLIEINAFEGLNITSSSTPDQEPVVKRLVSNNPDIDPESMDVAILTIGVHSINEWSPKY